MYRFDKSKRLLKKQDYDVVFQQAKKIVTADFIFLFRENTVGHARLGLVISKKNASKAHDRNRLKRILRETFRTHVHLPAIDIVVLSKVGVVLVKNALIIKRTNQVWGKLSLPCDK